MEKIADVCTVLGTSSRITVRCNISPRLAIANADTPTVRAFPRPKPPRAGTSLQTTDREGEKRTLNEIILSTPIAPRMLHATGIDGHIHREIPDAVIATRGYDNAFMAKSRPDQIELH